MSLDKTENNTNQELEHIKDIGLKNLLQKIVKVASNQPMIRTTQNRPIGSDQPKL